MATKTSCTTIRTTSMLKGTKGRKNVDVHVQRWPKITLHSYRVAKPQIFRIGDIVEVQISFIAVPLKRQNFKMLTVLRSIALLDSSFSEVRNNIQLRDAWLTVRQNATKKRVSRVGIAETTVKRKVGYGEERDKKTSRAMDIDEGN
jgi:hypothetical protein